ncbi:arginine/ornithine antiporter arcD [Vibrio sp. JCM 19236]|nr:arginine/ornithine antiporter arcD [Vibrio sp. JCM 19236]
MDMTKQTTDVVSKPWYRTMPDPMVLIFGILVATFLLTYLVPAGTFDRVVVDGKTTVVADSFHYIEAVAPVHVFDIFVAIPKGLISAAPYLFIVFIAGGLFHILQRSGALEKRNRCRGKQGRCT